MQIRCLLAILLLSVAFAAPVSAGELEVQQAYEQGHYKRTPFDAAQSRIKSQADVRFLQRMFAVSDNVLVARVMILSGIYTGQGANAVTYSVDMKSLIDYFSSQKAPEHLQKVQGLMLDLMEEQKNFMAHWASSTRSEKRLIEKTYERQAAVQNSNRKVQQIYLELMKLYPNESDYNKCAFFDHLYALDLLS